MLTNFFPSVNVHFIYDEDLLSLFQKCGYKLTGSLEAFFGTFSRVFDRCYWLINFLSVKQVKNNHKYKQNQAYKEHHYNNRKAKKNRQQAQNIAANRMTTEGPWIYYKGHFKNCRSAYYQDWGLIFVQDTMASLTVIQRKRRAFLTTPQPNSTLSMKWRDLWPNDMKKCTLGTYWKKGRQKFNYSSKLFILFFQCTHY